MQRDVNALTEGVFDLAIIGGGIFGCSAAWEAAHRGLSVALIEREDFSGATSANHLQMVHGGLGDLPRLNIARIREASRERSALLRIAPGLVYPLPLVVPTYGHGKSGKEIVRLGLWFYELVTRGRNSAFGDAGRHVSGGKSFSRAEALHLFPSFQPDGLTGAVVFPGAQMYNPPRIAVAFLRSAAALGAVPANYVEADGYIRRGEAVRGVYATDRLSGSSIEIRARVVLNAAGPWASHLSEKGLGFSLPFEPVLFRDTALVVRPQLSSSHAFAGTCRRTSWETGVNRGSAYLFLAPWKDHSLVGVWQVLHRGPPVTPHVSEEDIASYLEDVRHVYPPLSLSREDVLAVKTGLVYAGAQKAGKTGTFRVVGRSILVDHGRENGVEGLLTLLGVGASSARREAEKTVDCVFRKLERPVVASQSAELPLTGGDYHDFEELVKETHQGKAAALEEDVVRSLARNYGTGAREVLSYLEESLEYGTTLPGSTVIQAQVLQAIRQEMARTLADVVFRRTELGTAGNPGEEALLACSALAASELGWSLDRTRQELTAARAALESGVYV